MTGGELRVAMLGAVRHAAPYLAVLGRDPRVRLVGVSDEPDATDWILADGVAVAKRFGLTWFDDPARLCDPAVADLVVVCSEPTRHARLAGWVSGRGIAVCVDKPVATSTAQARDLLSAAGSAPVAVVNRLHGSELQRLRGWIDSGFLGLPRHVDVEFFAAAADLGRTVERVELLLDPTLSGGGELRNFLGYAVDAVRYLTGLDVVEVFAESASVFGGPHEAFGQEDAAVVSMLAERGVTATAVIGRAPAAPGGGPASSTIRVIGSHGHAEIDEGGPRLVAAAEDETQLLRPAMGDELESFFADLVGQLLTGGRPAYRLQDATASVAVVDAAVRSTATGRPERPVDLQSPR